MDMIGKFFYFFNSNPSLGETGARVGGGESRCQSVRRFFSQVLRFDFWLDRMPGPNRDDWEWWVPVAIIGLWLSLSLGSSMIMHAVIFIKRGLS